MTYNYNNNHKTTTKKFHTSHISVVVDFLFKLRNIILKALQSRTRLSKLSKLLLWLYVNYLCFCVSVCRFWSVLGASCNHRSR